MIGRRQFLRIAGAGATGFITGGLDSLLNVQPAGAKTHPDSKFIPDLEIALETTPAELPILPGNPTRFIHTANSSRFSNAAVSGMRAMWMKAGKIPCWSCPERAYSDSSTVWGLSGTFSLSLPQPGTRRYGNDAQLLY